jgi:serine/threonine-protein kinase
MPSEHLTKAVGASGGVNNGRIGQVAAGVDVASVRAQLEKILASSGFSGSERLGRFLRFIVEQKLQGQGDQVKETLVGVEVFGRKPTYDPRIDGVVRVEAVKLRARLQKYYENQGREDPILIDLPKGGYVPAFQNRQALEPANHTVAKLNWRIPAFIAALAVISFAIYFGTRGSTGKLARPTLSSIAVLPFRNLSSDQENQYFSDGLTEDLINALGKVPGLRVVARGSAFQFKGKAADIRTVGRELNVEAVLEGSVQKSGDRLRITTQLSSVADGYHLWSDTFDRQLKDVFSVQDEISRSIVKALEIRLAAGTDRQLVKPYTSNLEAYELYLQGRFHLNSWRAEGAQRGIEYFQGAIGKDPVYAPAFAGLADCYTWLATFGVLPARETMPKAREAAMEALRLDERLDAAHISLGYVKSLYDWDWPGAEREYKRALEPGGGQSDVLFAYGITYLAPQGRLDEALAAMARARDLDPLSAFKNVSLGMILGYRGEYDRAAQQCKKAIDLDPTFLLAYEQLRANLVFAGKYDEAYALMREMRKRFITCDDRGARAYIAARQGLKTEAQALLKEWIRGPQSRASISCGIAEIYAALGEKGRAFEWLDRAYEERNPMLAYLKVFPSYEPLRSDPRFTVLLTKMGLKN